MIRTQKISLNYLRLVLDYNPDNGIFTWSNKRLGRIPATMVAGSPDKSGHILIGIDQIRYKAHRLAWFYINGVWPPYEIDHINGIPSDNRINNLRLISARWQQRANQKLRKDNKSGLKGVSWHPKNGWRARCSKGGKVYCKYGFKTPEAAHICYVKMAAELFGEFMRVA